jgi:hypothetical protein
MNSNQTKSNKQAYVLLASSVIFTLFLFYIDEGYYNFKWMLQLSNWFAFVIYIIPIFGFQLLVLKLIGKIFSSQTSTFLSIIIGAIIGLTLVIYLLSK